MAVGRVDVKIKQTVELFIRIPEWTTPGQVRCLVNGQSRAPRFRGRYAEVGTVKAGEVVTLTFPIAERIDEVSIEKHKYTLIRKGNEVVRIDPQGPVCPLHQRAQYREGQTRWKNVTRFVTSERLTW
jgi:DUF1680 family protein